MGESCTNGGSVVVVTHSSRIYWSMPHVIWRVFLLKFWKRFPEMGVPLVIIHMKRIFHCKPSIWGHHHVWKPPFEVLKELANVPSKISENRVASTFFSKENPHKTWCPSQAKVTYSMAGASYSMVHTPALGHVRLPMYRPPARMAGTFSKT